MGRTTKKSMLFSKGKEKIKKLQKKHAFLKKKTKNKNFSKVKKACFFLRGLF